MCLCIPHEFQLETYSPLLPHIDYGYPITTLNRSWKCIRLEHFHKHIINDDAKARCVYTIPCKRFVVADWGLDGKTSRQSQTGNNMRKWYVWINEHKMGREVFYIPCIKYQPMRAVLNRMFCTISRATTSS